MYVGEEEIELAKHEYLEALLGQLQMFFYITLRD